jgi:hypothetical protein
MAETRNLPLLLFPPSTHTYQYSILMFEVTQTAVHQLSDDGPLLPSI